MKISFPYMGTSPLVVSYLFENLGHEVVCPPVPTEKTLSLGVQYAPEFACIPFKIVLGTYLEVLEMGAEVLITSGGCGPCRAGFYGELHRRILRDLGYPVEMIIMEPPLREPLDFLRKVYRLLKPAKLVIFIMSSGLPWKKCFLLMKLNQQCINCVPWLITRN